MCRSKFNFVAIFGGLVPLSHLGMSPDLVWIFWLKGKEGKKGNGSKDDFEWFPRPMPPPPIHIFLVVLLFV